MKKLFMFLAVAGLATFGASCSSDDGGGGDDQKTITLSADKTSVKVNETVTFTASEKDAEIYVGDKKISNSTKFDKEGSYNVIAKKKGFKDSNVVKITVTKGDVVTEKTLKITASAPEVGIGDNVTFTVKDQDNKDVTDVVIKANGTTVSNPWKTTEAGSFEVVVTKDGYKDGKTTVKVVRKGTLVLSLVTTPANVIENQQFEMKLVDGDNKPVSGATLYFEGAKTNVVSEDGVMKAAVNGPGTFTLYAELDGLKSNELTVVVNEVPAVIGDKSFVYKGVAYNINRSFVTLLGVGTISDTDTTVYSVWQVEGINMKTMKLATVLFTTPATPTGNPNEYSVTTPDGTNETAVEVAVLQVAEDNTVTVLDSAEVNINASFSAFALTSANVATGNFKATATSLGGQSFRYDYDGQHTYSKQSKTSAKSINSNLNQSFGKNIKVSNAVKSLSTSVKLTSVK